MKNMECAIGGAQCPDGEANMKWYRHHSRVFYYFYFDFVLRKWCRFTHHRFSILSAGALHAPKRID